MAVQIIGPPVKKEGHKCEIELTGRANDFIVDRDKNPPGMVTRCSCGILWTTVKYAYTYCQWVHAGWWLNFRYKNRGWEGTNESY